MRQSGRGDRQGGLTLIEVIFSLAILSLIATIVYSSLSTAILSWSAGIGRGRGERMAAVVLDRMSQQLKSAIPAFVGESEGATPAIVGREGRLQFVTSLSAQIERPLAQVSYSIENGKDGPHLVYREYPWPEKNFPSGSDAQIEEVIPGITRLKVRLEARREKSAFEKIDTEKEVEWEEGGDFPGLVEVTLEVAGGPARGGFTISTAAPLRSRLLR